MKGKGKVLVAMSGGVDSSVAAALLKEEGYEVVGATMQVWPEDALPPPGETGCCSLAAVDDARGVAGRLGIPHYVLNFREIFSESVINYFLEEYLQGRTPNPCIACNRLVKFEAFLAKALALEFDFVATGHYARIQKREGRHLLYRGKDLNKDQSYVLYSFTQFQMARTLLPLGDLLKGDVRDLARSFGLQVADKAESQEICFVTGKDYRSFLRERVGQDLKPGPFLDMAGRVVGEHGGLALYTVGQRRGLGLSLGYTAYVVALRKEENAVVVGPDEALYASGLLAMENNFIAMEEPEEPLPVEIKVRYRAPLAPATLLSASGGRMEVRFIHPQRAVAPGQAVVYYRGEMVLGGGTIEQAL